MSLWSWSRGPLSAADRQGATCFIPKSVDESLHVAPDLTRPITLMNVSYKVVATRCNWYITAILPDFIDDRWKGLTRGRGS